MVDTPSFKQDGYLTGLKLLLVLGSLTMVTFLVLLDTAIVGTVSCSAKSSLVDFVHYCVGHTQNHQ